MDIVMLGSGNVATHLGSALTDAGHRIRQVYSPNIGHAEALATLVGAKAIDALNRVDPDAGMYILAVKDDAIDQVATGLPHSLGGMVVHTAGSVDMSILAAHAQRYGVLYPVQTFSKAKAVDFSTIPLALEASDEYSYGLLAELATSLSGRIFQCDSKQRLSIHVAAVFACNFSNHFYAIGADILRAHSLDFDLIRPLILETAEKSMIHQPSSVQTGPAIRHDEQTMQKHLEFLDVDTELKELYETISRRIGNSQF